MTSALMPDDDFSTPAARSEAASALDRERQMREFSISRAGRYYCFEGYLYERLADAVAYAQVVRSRTADRPSASACVSSEADALPSESQRQLMTELGITCVDGRFVFDGFKYDRLADATNYAHLLRYSRPAEF